MAEPLPPSRVVPPSPVRAFARTACRAVAIGHGLAAPPPPAFSARYPGNSIGAAV